VKPEFLPICINVSGIKIVMIGGGKVALQKLTNLCLFAKNISVFATTILPAIKDLPVSAIECTYTPHLLNNAALVYACTNDNMLNRAIGTDARKYGALVNVADDPQNCDFISPALFNRNEMSVAVSSNGKKAKMSVQWRNAIASSIISGELKNLLLQNS
jgi:siroheme synthase-like protein